MKGRGMVGRSSKIILIIALAIGGCTKSMTPGKLEWVRADSDNHRAGNVYLIRGWLGVFSSGMDNLTREINENGVRAHVFQEDQWSELARALAETYKANPNHEPLVLVGHSFGADDVIRVARELQKDDIPVDLIVTLDPVTPPLVPTNVNCCINIYQSHGLWDTIPAWRGIPLTAESTSATQLANYNVRVNRTDLLDPDLDHANIEKKAKIHAEVIKHVLEFCPPRERWVATHGGPLKDNSTVHSIAAAHHQERAYADQ
jgi:hypothetical protein